MSKNLATPDNPIRIGEVAYVNQDEIPDFLRCNKCGLTYPNHMCIAARKRGGDKVLILCHNCAVTKGILAAGAVIDISHEKERAEKTMKELRDKEDG